MEGQRPFGNFYANVSRKKKGGVQAPRRAPDDLLESFEDEIKPQENDKALLHGDINEIFERCCDGDPDMLGRMRDEAGGADALVSIYKTADRDPQMFGPMLDLCFDLFDGDFGALRDFARVAGGGKALLLLRKDMGDQHLRSLLKNVPELKRKNLKPEDLRDEELVDRERGSVLQDFLDNPGDNTFRILFKLHLVRPGEVLKIVPASKGQFDVTLACTGALGKEWTIQAHCTGVEKPQAIVGVVNLVGPNAVVALKGDLKEAFADPFMIWMEWSEFAAESKGEFTRTRDRIGIVTFDELPGLDIKVVGSPDAYQTAGDLRDSAPFIAERRSCFSFCSDLGGDLAGVWVLHVHCIETAVDEDDKCTDFKMLAASLKLATEDRMVESSSTMKVVAKEAEGKKGKSKQQQAIALLQEQEGKIFELARRCSPHAVLGSWNRCKIELKKKGSHAVVYDRHNTAEPKDDLEGWAKTLTTNRIAFLFFTKKGLPGHLKVLRDEIGRFVAAARTANDKDIARYAEVAHTLMKALAKSAEMATSNKPMKDKAWEKFAFEIDIDFGPFGRFVLRRDAQNKVDAQPGPAIDIAPEVTLQRIRAFVLENLFSAEPDDFVECMALLADDAHTLGEAAARAKFGADAKLWYVLSYGVDDLCGLLTKLANAVPFDFKQIQLVFGLIGKFTMSRKNGVATCTPALKLDL